MCNFSSVSKKIFLSLLECFCFAAYCTIHTIRLRRMCEIPTIASIMFQGGNIALAMAQFLGPKVAAVCVQVLLLLGHSFMKSSSISGSPSNQKICTGGLILWPLPKPRRYEIQRPGEAKQVITICKPSIKNQVRPTK